MADVKTKVKYFLRIPGKYVYLSDDKACSIELTEFSNNTKMFKKDDAERLAERYGLEIVERTTTTTTEFSEKKIEKEVKR
jgi:hypothetical protein